MNLNIRLVDASHGWRWLVAGMLIFRKNPLMWMLLIALLFIGSRVLLAIPLVGVLAVLTAPNFLAGLAHGAQALEQGKPLQFGYLASGFLRHAGRLVTIGGVSLIGQFLTVMAMVMIGGESIGNVARTMAGGGATPEATQALRAAAPGMMFAVMAGLLVSLPLMMAVWFAPLLVFFDDLKPLQALAFSLRACLRNLMPFLLYAMAVLLPMLFLMPLSVAARQPDLALWLLAPILVPSIYASYQDIFVHTPAAQ